MKPEMKMNGNTYMLITSLGETVKLNYCDMLEIAKFLRHEEWKAQILENLDEEYVDLTDGQQDIFLDECIDEADSRYENSASGLVDIDDVYNYVAEDWGFR